jgi:uncharacterized protein (DUF58 family)
VIAIDGGQLMAEPLAGIPRLDHAINASLLLGWFCLRTGDRVGFASFDERLRSWAEPMAGAGAFPRLRHLTAEVDYRAVDTNVTSRSPESRPPAPALADRAVHRGPQPSPPSS